LESQGIYNIPTYTYRQTFLCGARKTIPEIIPWQHDVVGRHDKI
jgi:hypothetical protein